MEQRADIVRWHPSTLTFRLIFASLFVASAALGIGVPSRIAAATPGASASPTVTVQSTVTARTSIPAPAKPAVSPTSAPSPSASAAATTQHVSPSPAPAASATTPPVPSPTASSTAPAPPASPTPTRTVASPTPDPTAPPPTAAVRLVAPTTVPATPPPPPTPALDLAGLTILDNPGVGGNPAIARAALHHFGEYYRPDGVPWVGWCEMFVGNVLAEAGIPHPRYASAILDALDGPLYRGAAPAGSLVYFDQRSSPYGHVGVSLGDGTMLSALGGGVVRTGYREWESYLGWRPYGASAPEEAPLAVRTYGTTTDDVSLSWAAHGTAISDDLSLSWAAYGSKAHSPHGTPGTANLITPLSRGNGDDPPPYRSSQQMLK